MADLAIAPAVGPSQVSRAQDDGVVPASYQSGSFFNRQLGTALRFNYHTQGYGTTDGVFSLGGMKVVNMDDATVFFDGQGTLSDDFGGGYNLGVGYRQLTTLGTNFDPQRILGASFWTDGQSTSADNFFTQVGFALESLGESYDLRLNGHFPLERNKVGDAVLTGAGDPFFMGNNIFGATEEFTIDTALSVIDGEFAKRIMDLEAWAFAGAYHLRGGDTNTGGYRVGVRGYAVPDLAVSFAVTEDDVYDANFLFGITWFIGRTHKGNQPCGNIYDRFREPVLRNDFIAVTSRRESQPSGNPLTDPTDDEAIRIVHIDSNDGTTAAGGGDGTFENPFRDIADVDALGNPAGSMEGDIILVHGGSSYAGAVGTATLQDDQTVLGEGVDQDMNEIVHVVDTVELGLINLPETATDAQTMARPTIDAGGADVFTLADNNTINNFTINNAGTAVLAAPDDAVMDDTLATPTLQNLQINDAVIGVALRDVFGTAVVENTVEINGATTTALEVDGGESGMSLGATINETVGRSLDIQNRMGGTIDFTGQIDDEIDRDGNAIVNASQGVRINLNQDSVINVPNAQNIVVGDGETAFAITNNIGTVGNTTTINVSGAVDVEATGSGQGVDIDGNNENSTITFADLNATAVNGDTVRVGDGGTVTISSADDTRTIANTGTGRALFNEGFIGDDDRNASLTVNSNITNGGGGVAVQIQNRSANNVFIAGTVDVENADGAGVLVQDNIDGNITFSNALTLNTGAFDAVTLTDNSDGTTEATISFSELDIDTTGGNGFTATGMVGVGGGNLIVTNAVNPNTIDVDGNGVGLTLQNMTIDGAGVAFDVVNVDNDVVGGPDAGIDLQNLEGGAVTIGGGTDPGDGGMLMTDGTGINIDNVNNVTITNVTVDNPGAAAGLVVTGQQTGSSATFNGLDVTTVNGNAVDINGNDDGTITFNTIAATTTGTGTGINLDNVDGSTVAININDATVNSAGAGFDATGGGVITVAGTNEINSTAGTAFNVNDTEDLTASNVTINNTTQQGVNVTGLSDATDSVTLNNFDVTTTSANAVTVSGNTEGTIVFNNLTAESVDGETVFVDNNGNATVSFNDVDATATGSGDAFTATGGGTLIATGTNNASANNGRGVFIQDMTIDTGVTFANVDVTAGTTTGIELDNNTGDGIVVNGGTITTNNAAVSVTDTDNATISGVDINNAVSSGAGVVASNTAGDTLTLNNVTIDGDANPGVDVDGGTFVATGTNTITTVMGTALEITNAEIGAGGASFSEVNVNNAPNAVVLDNLTGAQVTVGSSGTASTLNTTSDAVIVTNAANVNLNNMDITSGDRGLVVTNSDANNFDLAADDLTINSTNEAVAANHTGDGNFTFAVTNSDLNNVYDLNADGAGIVDVTFNDTTVDSTGTDVAFTLALGNSVSTADIQVLRSQFTADDAVAFDFDSNSAAVKNVTFQLSNSTTNNNSASPSAEVDAFGPTVMNATITTNTFTNTGAGDNFDIATNNATSVINMIFTSNSTVGGTDSVVLRELNGSDFNIVDAVNVETNNGGVGNFIYDSPGNVNGDFDDIPALP